MNVLIIGVGLIGGSFALALRDRGLAECIEGVEASEEHARRALERGLVDRIVTLEEGLPSADLIVLATPVYFYTMCAQMKTMIDRTLGGAQTSGLENKEFYLIATAADGKAAMERTVDGLRGYLECLPGAKEMGVVYGAGVWKIGDVQKNAAFDEAYQMGQNVF